MKRVIAIAACGLSLAGCSSLPNWMQFSTPSFLKSAPTTTSMQFESEPAGAEARTSTGQACRTPCSLSVGASEFTVSFALPGYQAQTVPVRLVTSNEPRDPNVADADAPRLVPNPVFVELQPAAPPPAARKPAQAKPKPKPAPRPAPTAMAPEPPPSSPAPAPASPWPPAPAR